MSKTSDSTEMGGVSRTMKDPKIQAAITAAATAALGPMGAVIGPLIGTGLSIGGDYLGAKNEQDVRDMQSEALQGYLNSIDQRREQAKNYMQGNFDKSDAQMQTLLNTPLPELGQMKSDITEQATDAQQNNDKQIQAQLAKQGVRGGQAATLAGEQTGQLNRELNYDVNKLGYNEAQNRQNANLNYTGQKALMPYQTLNKDQWLYMPNASEQQLMMNAINTKFA